MALIKNTLQGIKLFFTNAFRSRKNFGLFLFIVVVIALIAWNSGNAYVVFGSGFFGKVVPYVVLLLMLGIIYVTRIDIDYLKKSFSLLKTKRFYQFFDPLTTMSALLVIAIFFSMVFNNDLASNLNNYIGLLLTIMCSFFIAKICSFDKFIELFSKTMFVFSLIGLVVFFVQRIVGIQASSMFFLNETRSLLINNFFFLYTEPLITSGLSRITSIFWEPGVYATFLIFALLFQLVFAKKTNWFFIATFAVSLILTRSTAGYILLVFVIIAFASEKIKNQNWIWLYIAVICVAGLFFIFSNEIIDFLKDFMPDVFSKIFNSTDASYTTRILSPYYFFLVFLQNPLFGLGGTTALSVYYSIVPQAAIDAGTSSSAYILASIGVLGMLFTLIPLIGIIRTKRINIFTKLLVCIIFLALMNKENHTNILAVSSIYFIFLTRSAREKADFVFKKNPTEKKVLSIFLSGSQGGVISRNIAVSFVIKGLALVVGFVTIPIYNSYFGDDSTFGVWLVIISVLLWILTFDLGLGNGLKNKLIEAKQKGETDKVKTLISSTYFSTAVISGIFFLIGVVLTLFLDFNTLFNIAPEILSGWDLKIVVLIVLFGVCVEFLLKNVLYILQALQKTALSSSLMLISNVIILSFVTVFSSIGINNKFLILAIVYSVSVNLPLLVTNIIVFRKTMKGNAPSLKKFNFNIAKQVMKLGVLFFALQLVTLFIWSFNEIIISNLYGTAAVADYTKYYKLFGFMGGILGTVIQYPIWTAVSKAYVEKNARLIKKMHLYCILFAALFFLINVILGLFLQSIFDIWLGEHTIVVQPYVVWVFIIYSAVHLFAQATVIICNAIEALKYLLIVNIIGAILKIPLTYLIHFLTAGDVSWSVVIIVNTIIYIPNLIIPYLEIRKKIAFSKKVQA